MAIENRPWGTYEILRDTDKFKTKLITVAPGHRLSLQYHHKREEHWLIVSGTGKMELGNNRFRNGKWEEGNDTFPVKPGQYIHIPVGAQHRIQNDGTEPLLFLELQLGAYFGEDDIVRLQDDYRRGNE